MVKRYIQIAILPKYRNNAKSHNLTHIEYVINRSMRFAEGIPGINMDMVYTIAAYHDVGHSIDPKNHEMISAEILRKDKNLRKFFTEEQIEVMAQAVEDHRSSLKGVPRSIYGKIVASADRGTDLDYELVRTYLYRKKHFPDMTLDDIIKDSLPVIRNHFGRNGSSKRTLYFQDKEFNAMSNEVDRICSNITLYKDVYLKALKKYNYIW